MVNFHSKSGCGSLRTSNHSRCPTISRNSLAYKLHSIKCEHFSLRPAFTGKIIQHSANEKCVNVPMIIVIPATIYT